MALDFKRRLVSQEDQSLVKRPDIPRSKFFNRWTRKTTFDAGLLIPFMVDEIYPGDHMKYNTMAYLRMQTPLFPIFDNQRIDTFFFFVPTRLVWTNFKRFMGEQPTGPGDSIAFTVPQVVSAAGGFVANSIYDHFGLPVVGQITAGQTITVNSLPFRAYALIYDQWFRDQNIITYGLPSFGDGPDGVSTFSLLRRAKSHDYFTSALPWPQKFVAPNVPIAGTAPVLGLGWTQAQDALSGPQAVEDALGNTSYTWYKSTATPTTIFSEWTSQSGVPNIRADLSAATGVSINTFRQAFLVQQLLERDARGGTRYTEIMRNHFGVISPDARLQRPEYIGGGSTPLNVTPVAQTATGGNGLGSLGAAATSVGQHRADYAATEHGYIIGLINVRSELSYSQGVHRMWRRLVRNDFMWPSLAGLGEQAILREELYCTGTDAEDTAVFGYQERYQELRTRYSEVTGLFRPTTTGNIDEWHLSQQLSAGILNQTFIEDSPPMTRVLAAGGAANNAQYLADILIEREAVRPLPMFGTPVTLGRF